MNQLNLFGSQLRDEGIQRAIVKADKDCENWSSKAFDFLINYSKLNKQFMTEDVREASIGVLEQPKNGRAWGGVVVRAVKSGLIIRKGFMNVKNHKAHCTPASVWIRI